MELTTPRPLTETRHLKAEAWPKQAHVSTWKERGPLSSQGTPIQYGEEIAKLLLAVLQPEEVPITHCKAHRRGNSEIIKGH